MALSPIDRKVELLRKGVSMSDIARQLDPPVSAHHVSRVVAGERRSPRIEAAVANAIDLPLESVFDPQPERAAVG